MRNLHAKLYEGGLKKKEEKKKEKEFFFAGNDKEGAGTEPEPEIIMGPIHIFKQYFVKQEMLGAKRQSVGRR